jgi:integrase/recombinase XerC
VPICHEWNTIAHLNDYEGSPEARPLSREELQRFFDYADEQVDLAARANRKGALTAYRDATLFKVIYGWGLRRTEAAKLDLCDWAATRLRRNSAGSACCTCATARPCAANRRGGATWPR